MGGGVTFPRGPSHKQHVGPHFCFNQEIGGWVSGLFNKCALMICELQFAFFKFAFTHTLTRGRSRRVFVCDLSARLCCANPQSDEAAALRPGGLKRPTLALRWGPRSCN